MLINHLDANDVEKKQVCFTANTALEEFPRYDSIKMDYKEKLDVKTGRALSYWMKTLSLPNTTKTFYYKFHVIDKSDGQEFQSERECVREFSLDSFYEDHEDHQDQKDSRNFVKDNIFTQCSFKFRNLFSFNEITESLFIGCYPHCKSDVLTLKNKGIRAVLNLQTKSDMIRNDIDWDRVRQHYSDCGIKVMNVPIKDKDPSKIHNYFQLVANALAALKLLLDKFGKVYVHCTYGIIRAPTIAILYLTTFNNLSIQDATNLVKHKRKIAKLKEDALARISQKIIDTVPVQLKLLHMLLPVQ